MRMYTTLMSAYGASAGIAFKFGGTVANTLPAHRVIQYFQESKGAEVADRLVLALYRMYFEEERHPSSAETLLAACKEAGVEDGEAARVVGDEDEGMAEVKMLLREVKGNGVDSVPVVSVEGRRRDVELVGAREVEEYLKVLQQIAKESE